MTRVAVCIPTRNRLPGLETLLRALGGLVLDDPAPGLRVVVVDNDVAQSARDLVTRLSDEVDVELLYLADPRPGVAHVRNTAVAATGDVEFVVFIDDDEIPNPRWLAELLLEQRRHDADVVAGPVHPDFRRPPPRWLADAGFLEPLSGAPGELRSWAATGNVLVRRSLFDEEQFDPGYGLSGGEDVVFFQRAAARGARIVWAPAAIVREAVPDERLRLRWHLRRGLREGNLSARAAAEVHPGPAPLLRRGLLDLRTLLRCAVGSPIALLLGQRGRALRGLRTACSAMGALAAAGGWRYEQYGGAESRWAREHWGRGRTGTGP